MPLNLIVRGRRACFPRPEFSRDFVTYDIITPLAARVIFDQLYRPRGLRWELQRIETLKPVERAWEPASGPGQFPRVLALHEVSYRLSAVLLDSTGRDRSSDHEAAFAQRLATAATTLSLNLGFREFAAHLSSAPARARRMRIGRVRDFGWMPYDTGEDGSAAVLYFHAVAIDGVIDLTSVGPSSLAM